MRSMNISVNGESKVPPGFRFHPTEEELLQYYLRKKICYEKIDLDVIRDVDLNKLEPWDIQEKCKIGSTPQNDWYLFSHKDKKYPTGTRTNRATTVGFWKATGRDKVIHSNGRKRIGMRKTLVFYTGRAPNAKKSEWIMHEYRLDDDDNITTTLTSNSQEEVGWVVCRVFKKKSHLKSIERPSTSSVARETGRTNHLFDSCDDGTLEQVLEKIGKGYKEEKLPSLDSQKYRTMSKESQQNTNEYYPIIPVDIATESEGLFTMGESSMMNWETLDRLVASQLNSQTEAAYSQLCCFCNDPTVGYCITCSSSSIATTTTTQTMPAKDYPCHDIDLWNFVPSTTSQPFTVPPVNTSNVTL